MASAVTSFASDDRTFHAVFHHAVDAVFLGAPDGRIFFANPAACEMFGATEEELRHMGRQGISNPDDPAWQSYLAERGRNRSVRGLVPMYRLDGTPMLVEVSSAIFDRDEGDERSCVIVRNVTERVRMERRLVAYDEITEALLAGAEDTDVLELVARHACAVFNAAFASVVTPAGSERGVVISAAFGLGADELVGQSFPPGGLPEEVMTSRRPRRLADITAVTRTRGLRALDLGPGMIVPIVSGGASLGALCVAARPGQHPYTTDDLDAACQYAARTGVALALGQARAEVERRQRLTNEQLQRALETRLIVEQSKGFLACLRGIDTDEAFDRLRKYARSHNTDIHVVARQVLDRRLFL